MPEYIKVIFDLLKDNPALLADVLDLIKRVVALLEKYPDLSQGLARALNSANPQ